MKKKLSMMKQLLLFCCCKVTTIISKFQEISPNLLQHVWTITPSLDKSRKKIKKLSKDLFFPLDEGCLRRIEEIPIPRRMGVLGSTNRVWRLNVFPDLLRTCSGVRRRAYPFRPDRLPRSRGAGCRQTQGRGLWPGT